MLGRCVVAKEFEQFTLQPRAGSRNSVNGVPVDLLDGHLPPPEPCPDCGYPTWMLVAPDSVRTSGRPDMAIYRAEYEPSPDWKCDGQVPGRCKIHPYHLRPHRLSANNCYPNRLEPVFPVGLIVRPPRTGAIND